MEDEDKKIKWWYFLPYSCLSKDMIRWEMESFRWSIDRDRYKRSIFYNCNIIGTHLFQSAIAIYIILKFML